jgi:uncharacterized membrane protein YqiK
LCCSIPVVIVVVVVVIVVAIQDEVFILVQFVAAEALVRGNGNEKDGKWFWSG